jgi:hypothetical protein
MCTARAVCFPNLVLNVDLWNQMSRTKTLAWYEKMVDRHPWVQWYIGECSTTAVSLRLMVFYFNKLQLFSAHSDDYELVCEQTLQFELLTG